MYNIKYELRLDYFHDYDHGYEVKREDFASFDEIQKYIDEDKDALFNLCKSYNEGYGIAVYVLDEELTEQANLLLEKALIEQENNLVHQVRLQKEAAEQLKEAQERKLYESLKKKYGN